MLRFLCTLPGESMLLDHCIIGSLILIGNTEMLLHYTATRGRTRYLRKCFLNSSPWKVRP